MRRMIVTSLVLAVAALPLLNVGDAAARIVVGGGVVLGAPYYYYPPYYSYYPPYYPYPPGYPPAVYPYPAPPNTVPPPSVRDEDEIDRRYCREYHRYVIIDGIKRKIYGHACRQPDGTWKMVD